MEPVSLSRLQALLSELQTKLDQTTSNSKRFKLGLKIDKCRAMIERRMPTAAASTEKKKNPPTSSPSPAFTSIAAPLRPTASELTRRASRFERDEKEHRKKKRPGGDLTLRDARRRAEASSSAAAATAATSSSPPPAAASAAAFGSREALEKPYLRLTSLPTVADVRPPRVLAEALALLKRKWRERAAGAASSSSSSSSPPPDAASSAASAAASAPARDYYASYFREQLKSLRQDLVVQGVRGALAVEAYETHARVALEAGDVAEFNQCQTALEELYREAEGRLSESESAGRGRRGGGSREGKGGGGEGEGEAEADARRCLRNRAEFSSYRVLYSQAMALSSPARPRAAAPSSSSAAAVALAMQSVRPADRGDPLVLRALEAAVMAREGDAAALAAALEGAPRMSPYLLDLLLPRARAVAASALVAAWRGGGGAGGAGGSGTACSLTDAARLLGVSPSAPGGGESDGGGGGEREQRAAAAAAAAAAAELLRAAGAVVDAAAGTVSVPRSSAAAAAAATAAAPSSKKSKDAKKRDRGAGDDGDKKEKKKKKKKR